MADTSTSTVTVPTKTDVASELTRSQPTATPPRDADALACQCTGTGSAHPSVPVPVTVPSHIPGHSWGTGVGLGNAPPGSPEAFAHCRWVADTRVLSSIVDSIVGIEQHPEGNLSSVSEKSTASASAGPSPGGSRFYPTFSDLPMDIQETFNIFDSVGYGLAYSIEHEHLKGKDALKAWEYVDLFHLLHAVCVQVTSSCAGCSA